MEMRGMMGDAGSFTPEQMQKRQRMIMQMMRAKPAR
jgi:hypothetical protein